MRGQKHIGLSPRHIKSSLSRGRIVREMPHIYQRLVYVLPATTCVALFALFQVTNTISIGPGGILLIFILLYLFFLSSFFILLHMGLSVAGRFIARKRAVQP